MGRRVELNGEYDLSRKGELALLFASLDANEPIVVDMADVTYIDSNFLHELVALRNRCREFGVKLTGVTPNVSRILRVVGFDKLFEIAFA
jgi:anti-anti-sigma factor